MRAAVCPAYGPPDVVRVEEQQSPSVAAGQVRVRVRAAAVNFPDVLLIANQYQISVPAPFVPGSEFAGVIVETGSGTDAFVVGDRVTGTGMYGAFAEEVAVASAGLALIPDGIDDRTAAAFGVAYRTAYHTLRSVARVRSGDEVVVLGAGGGVGLAAVQLGGATRRIGHRRCVVGRKARRGSVIRRHDIWSTTGRRGLRDALREALPDGADCGRRSSGRRTVRTRTALATAEGGGSSPSGSPPAIFRASR